LLKKSVILLTSLALLAVAALVSPSADTARGVPDYQPVAGWPKLPDGKPLSGVTAVATDAADNVYVFHRGKQPIQVFDRDGRFLRGWGEGLIRTAHGLRIDPAGNVWVTDIGHHLVIQFDPNGKMLRTLGKKGQPGDGRDQFNKPTDVAGTPAGEFYVADGYGNSRVVKFAKDGSYLKEWGTKGTGEGQFNLPHAIVLDGQGNVHVGDRENNRVQVFDAEGRFLSQWKESGAPYGLFRTGKAEMLVADGRGNRVRVLDGMGKPLGQWGTKGKDAGQFLMPHGICMDSKGAIYVAEVTGQRVQKFVPR
jgi:DNA-binding beta-propeller fold protein YncE